MAVRGGLNHRDRSLLCQTGVPCLMRVEAKDGGREGDKSVCKSASQLTFFCSATIRRSVQSRITSLHERLALSRIKEESVHVGEVKCHRSTAGRIEVAAVRQYGWGRGVCWH